MPNFVELFLSCGSWQEAQRVADELLRQRLVACVEFIPIQSKYHWHDKSEEARQVKLIMQSIAENFDKVEAAVARLHGYEAFVLQAQPIEYVSKEAYRWLESELERVKPKARIRA